MEKAKELKKMMLMVWRTDVKKYFSNYRSKPHAVAERATPPGGGFAKLFAAKKFIKFQQKLHFRSLEIVF